VSSFMSPRVGQRGSAAERVRRRVEIRALDEASKVPWRILADAADEYTEWQVFALWLRAVRDVREALPAEVAMEIEKRSPLLLSRIESELGNAGRSVGTRVWECVTQWAEANVFAEPTREGWLNAIRYFSSRSLRSMKAWSYWEDVHKQWRAAMPQPLPDYDRWTISVSAVTRLSNPQSEAQRVLDSVRSIPAPRWQQLLEAFLELTTLCFWIKILLGAERTGAELVAQELKRRYPRFDTSCIKDSADTISTFMDWVIGHEPPFANAKPPLLTLGYCIKCHPAYYARRNYAAHCRGLWSDGHFDRLAAFSEWINSADGYFER
jgi:hypothetical protein